MSARAAADALGIDKATLTRWIAAGKIGAEKLPGEFGAFVLDEAAVVALKGQLDTAAETAAISG